ncbi:uncharacterized protein LOC144686979 [Cetorhinus maximus]
MSCSSVACCKLHNLALQRREHLAEEEVEELHVSSDDEDVEEMRVMRSSKARMLVMKPARWPDEAGHSIVDGIETDNSAPASQKFEFSTKQLNEDNSLYQLSSGEAEETKQNISKLNQEMSYLSQQVTQLSKDLQDMMQLLKPLLTSHKYIPPSPDLALNPSLAGIYSNSSGFSSVFRSQAPPTAQTFPNLLRPDFQQRGSWPDSNPYPPRSSISNLNSPSGKVQTVHASLSLDSFLVDSFQHADDRGSEPQVLNQSVTPDTNQSSHEQFLHEDIMPHVSSPSIASDNFQQARQPDEHNAKQSKAPLAKLSLPADADCVPDKMAELLSPFSIRLTREPQRSETCSFELIRTSAEDSSSDSIQFIDDEGTNV